MAYNPTVEEQNFILLAGQRSPGIADITNADLLLRYDKRRGYGLSYGTSIFRGVVLAEPIVTLRLYSQQDWDDWDAFKPLVQRPPQGTRPRAKDISHPLLEMMQIRSVVVQSVGQPKELADGEWAIVIKFLEFNHPEFALARPEAAEAQELDPEQRQISELTEQITGLYEGTP